MSPAIGRFEVVREIGKSDLGTVYKAYDPGKKRTVALRVLRADTPQAIERSRRYLAQAKAASVLDSPNIVSIYAGAEEQGLAYVVMEFVEGVPLDAALATQQGFSPSELLDISRQVCRGLDHAHSKGMFHRRLTPPGILTEWDGTVKILDFAADPGPLEGKSGDELRYLSPEQVQGRAPDARSNVFNWGAILYEMVTGRKAFGDGDAASVQREILEAMPPAPNEVNPKVQIGISRVVMKALAKNPEYRFQHAGDLVSELEAECGAASRPSLPGVPQVNVPPPPLAPSRLETGPSTIPGLSPYLESITPSPAASAPAPLSASPAPNPPRSEPLLGYAIPAPAAPAWAKSPAPVVAAPAVAAPSHAQETIAPPPARVVAASGPVSLTPQQIKILVGVIGAALVVMVVFMVADSVRARRLRAEAEAAAAAPLVGTAAPDSFTASPAPVLEPLELRPTVIEIVPPTRPLKARRKAVSAPAAPAVGELLVNSVPQGAQVQVDGSGVGLTPLSLASLSPGQHLVVLSKAGYAVESRSVVVHGGTRIALAVSLNQLAAVASISSDPPGAAIIIDGRDTGKVTPAKLAVGQGNHSLAVRKAGYLETSASLALNPGETFQFQPTLKPLGNADDIKQVGKFKKLIGRGGQENASRVLVRTFPKGAQIMFNSRMMDRTSPAEFLLGAGTYEVTLTLTGYKTVHKTITVESGGRMEVNETMER
ncbi:MAG TPA: serine/threonine-protein kinase [Terriglobales bacterium]|nr:serine/threonine-protein kinase [Terriglobales bacterium]